MDRTAWGFLVVIVVSLSFGACGPSIQTVRMDPMTFTASKTDSGVHVDALDPEFLFKEASKDFDDKKYSDSIRKFSLLIEHFPESELAVPARFNRGLTHLAAKKPRAASSDFIDFLKLANDPQDQADALLRLGEASNLAGDWSQATDALRRRLTIKPMTLNQEIETRARLIFSLRMTGMFKDARNEVEKVASLQGLNATLPEIQANYFVAMSAFEGAAVWHDIFKSIRFILPTDRMEKDLTDKATLFLKAQAEYLRTIRLGNPFWRIQAGISIGRMYEEFYDSLLSAQTPPEFTKEQLDIYISDLKSKAKPLLAKALVTYERNLSTAKMYRGGNEWIEEMEARINRLKEILESDSQPK